MSLHDLSIWQKSPLRPHGRGVSAHRDLAGELTPLAQGSVTRGRFRVFLWAALLAPILHTAAAGDILRGGAPMPGANRRTATGTGASSGTADATALQTRARDRLSRTAASLDAVKALQAAARAAAGTGKSPRRADPAQPGKLLPGVRDGLGKNGLQVDPLVPKNLNKPKAGENPGLWIGAKLPTQANGKAGAKNVTIVQTDQQALLNWETFNVGKKTSLYFDQTAGGSDKSKWVAFNKVNDPKGRPSQILGSIKADGQVYVINQNGIIFGSTSQVNVHTLVASALPINDSLVARGLLNNPDAQFLFSALVRDTFATTNTPKTLTQAADGRGQLQLTYTDKLNIQQTFTPADYTVAVGADGRSTITFTAAGASKLANQAGKDTTIAANYLTTWRSSGPRSRTPARFPRPTARRSSPPASRSAWSPTRAAIPACAASTSSLARSAATPDMRSTPA